MNVILTNSVVTLDNLVIFVDSGPDNSHSSTHCSPSPTEFLKHNLLFCKWCYKLVNSTYPNFQGFFNTFNTLCNYEAFYIFEIQPKVKKCIFCIKSLSEKEALSSNNL